MVSYNDVFNDALAVNQDSDLPCDLMGNFGEISRYLWADDLLRGDPSSIYAL
jgi:hypothetical protein